MHGSILTLVGHFALEPSGEKVHYFQSRLFSSCVVELGQVWWRAKALKTTQKDERELGEKRRHWVEKSLALSGYQSAQKAVRKKGSSRVSENETDELHQVTFEHHFCKRILAKK